MSSFSFYAEIFAGLVTLLIVRIVPIWPVRNRGTDAFFYLLCAETFRKEHKIPITLPELFLMEPTEQWYPPLFPVLMGILPKALVTRGFWLINHLLDAVPAVFLFGSLLLLLGPIPAWCGLLLYATTPDLVFEYQGLVSRPLANLLFQVCIITAGCSALIDMRFLLAAIIALVALLYTHKLTIQLVWFLLPFLAIVRGEPMWIVLLTASYLVAAIVGRSLFVKVLRAHLDIVAFWNRNWRWLGAHQVKNSPIYGDGERAGFHELTGVALLWRHLKSLFIRCPWSVPAIYGTMVVPGDAWTLLALQLLLGILLWGVLTLWVPFLRCLGDGIKYLKYTIPLCLFLTIRSLAVEKELTLWALTALAVVWHLYHYTLVLKDLRRTDNPVGNVGPCLDTMASILLETPDARVACIPVHLAEGLAYKSRKPVLWGAHGYGLTNLDPFFPVLRVPIQDLAHQYHVTHFLLDTRYTTTNELGLTSAVEQMAVCGTLALYAWRP